MPSCAMIRCKNYYAKAENKSGITFHVILPDAKQFTRRNIGILTTLTSLKEKIPDSLFLEKYFVFENKNLLRLHEATGEEVVKDIDLSNKSCLITGPTSGIGLEMSRCLSARNCDLIMACRNVYKANNVARSFSGSKQNKVKIYEVDLGSFKSVTKCAQEIIDNEKKLDIVILNAAVFGLPWTLTEDGVETTFQVNFLSQFHLLMRLERLLAPDARVVFVSSESHRNIQFDSRFSPVEDLALVREDNYTSIRAYNVSKLCSLYAMHYLAYRWLNTTKQVFAAHPGTFVKTKLCQNWWVYEALYNACKPFTKTVCQAAATPLYCATSPDLTGLTALYYKNCRQRSESDLARDFHLAFRVIDRCKDLIRRAVNELSHKEYEKQKPAQEKAELGQERLVF